MVMEKPKSDPSKTEIVVTAEMDNATKTVTLKSVTFDGEAGNPPTPPVPPGPPIVLLHVDVIAPKGGGGGVCVTSGGVTVCH